MIVVASDHAGVDLKGRIVTLVSDAGHELRDLGPGDTSSVDYPDYAHAVAKAVAAGEAERGILICGTGIGMSITANKFAGVRAASCYDEVMVEMSRRHNDVNVLCLPGDMIGDRPIDEMVLMWLHTDFDGGRHIARIEKICKIEQAQCRSTSASVEQQ